MNRSRNDVNIKLTSEQREARKNETKIKNSLSFMMLNLENEIRKPDYYYFLAKDKELELYTNLNRKKIKDLENKINIAYDVLDEYKSISDSRRKKKSELKNKEALFKKGYYTKDETRGSDGKKKIHKSKKSVRYKVDLVKIDLSEEQMETLKEEIKKLKEELSIDKRDINTVFENVLPLLKDGEEENVNKISTIFKKYYLNLRYKEILSMFQGLKQSVTKEHINDVYKELLEEDIRRNCGKQRNEIEVPEEEKHHFDDLLNEYYRMKEI